MKQKYPSKLINLRFYDIRSGKLPKEENLMLFILVGDSDLVVGGYSNGTFWDGTAEEVIDMAEVSGWAYYSYPVFVGDEK